MRGKRFISLLALLFMTACAACAQDGDTLQHLPQAIFADTVTAIAQINTAAQDDPQFLVFLLLFGLGFFILSFVCVLAGLALAGVLCLLFISFLSLGILSASFVAGLRQKSFSSGFRVFLVLCAIVAGTVIGIAGAFILSALLQYNLPRAFLFGLGSVSGIAAGFILGQLLFAMFRRLLNYGKEKLRLN